LRAETRLRCITPAGSGLRVDSPRSDAPQLPGQGMPGCGWPGPRASPRGPRGVSYWLVAAWALKPQKMFDTTKVAVFPLAWFHAWKVDVPV
jgi:hypothetical protein